MSNLSNYDSACQQEGTAPVGQTVIPCGQPSVLNVLPRHAAQVLDSALTLRRLLPIRYPPASTGEADPVANRLKHIENNFYPDLATSRTLCAVVTEEPWHPTQGARPTPSSGRTVSFALGPGTTVPTANLTLAPAQATTNADGMAETVLTLTLDAQLSKQNLVAGQNVIEVVATLEGSTPTVRRVLLMTVHRNEDVDTALGTREDPAAFQATLEPVTALRTWLVHQPNLPVQSAGVTAVQQLLNQVACRRRGAQHPFVDPAGLFDDTTRTALDAFRTAFGTAPTGTALADYQNTRFGVCVEAEVLEYLRLEYGRSDAQVFVVDGHLLEGKQRWAAGGHLVPTSATDTGGADGLLDIFTSVVWYFITRQRARAREYITAQTRWLRHPNDYGGTGWPSTVTLGEAYTYGGDKRLDSFLEHHPQTETTAHWNLYAAGSYVGLHSGNNKYGSACNWVILNTQSQALTTAASVNEALGTNSPTNEDSIPAARRVIHNYPGSLGSYTGIDCSAFQWRCCSDPQVNFENTHCTDLANQRIWRNGETIGRPNTGGWVPLYRQILLNNAPAGRRRISYRGDMLNVAGSHIVMLDAENRSDISSDAANPGTRIEINHANGGVSNFNGNNGQCPRRTVTSPLSAWSAANNSWLNNGATVHHGRIYLWRG